MAHRIFIPYSEPQVIKGSEDISLDSLQTIIKKSDTCLHILKEGKEGQLKTISNLYKKPVTIRCGIDIEIEKNDNILLIYELNKYISRWHLISNLAFMKRSLSVPRILKEKKNKKK